MVVVLPSATVYVPLSKLTVTIGTSPFEFDTLGCSSTPSGDSSGRLPKLNPANWPAAPGKHVRREGEATLGAAHVSVGRDVV